MVCYCVAAACMYIMFNGSLYTGNLVSINEKYRILAFNCVFLSVANFEKY